MIEFPPFSVEKVFPPPPLACSSPLLAIKLTNDPFFHSYQWVILNITSVIISDIVGEYDRNEDLVDMEKAAE